MNDYSLFKQVVATSDLFSGIMPLTVMKITFDVLSPDAPFDRSYKQSAGMGGSSHKRISKYDAIYYIDTS